MADQCRAIKPAGQHDKGIVHCARRRNHIGPHSNGRYNKWVGTYTPTATERKG